MYSPISSKAAAAGVLVATSLLALPAHAHISMTGALLSRGGDQKSSPCDGARGDGPMYTFEPGTTIMLSVAEQIPHPSYFRIAFDNDGEDAFKEPKSIKPIDPTRRCPIDANDKCGESDFCNMKSATGDPTVLWDNLEPHMAGGLKTYNFTVKLPDVECEKCTIQVLQIMEDDAAHGPYCPSDSCMDTSLEDIYHRCIDITLKKGATNSPGVATGAATNMGMDCVAMAGPAPTAGTGAAAGSGAGGAAGGATAGAGATAGMSAAGAGGAGPSAGTAAGGGGSAGRASSAAGSASTPIGTAGRAASTTAGSGGSAGIGVSQSPTTAAGAAGAAAPAAAPATSTDSGCSVVMGTQPGTRSVGWLPLAAAALLMWSRKRAQARKPR